jgi:hypothetical protein
MMFPGGIERALGIAEISEWFDWMRREIPRGGIGLPPEETAASFAGHALRLRDRIRGIYRHLPISLENRLIGSMIVYQCWELHRDLYSNAELTSARRKAALITVEAERYVRPMGPSWGYHLVEGRDGFRYLITVPSGLDSETQPATEVICNRLARLVGLAVPDAVIVSVDQNLLGGHDTRPGRSHPMTGHAPELCAGFRYPEPHQSGWPPRRKPFPLDRRSTRHLMGALVFDTWTLNLSPRQWSSDFSQATGRIEIALVGDAGGLAGGDWSRFLDSTHLSLPGVQAIAAKVRRWEQIGPWIGKMAGADLNPIWELAFQMPPAWYGGSGRTLSHVLDKLSRRQWDLPRALHNFVKEGYLPALKMRPSRAITAPDDQAHPLSEARRA